MGGGREKGHRGGQGTARGAQGPCSRGRRASGRARSLSHLSPRSLPGPVPSLKKKKNAQVVARQDDHVLHRPVFDVRKQPGVLAHRVRRALEPLLVRGRLRGGQDLDEAVPAKPHARPDVVRAGEVAVEGGGVELGEDVHLVDAGVDAVGHGDVDEAVGAADGDGGLGALLEKKKREGGGWQMMSAVVVARLGEREAARRPV